MFVGINLNKKGEGDFLRATGSADLIVVCFIFNGTNVCGLSSLLSDGPHDPTYNQSDNHHISGAWHDAAKRFGARFIVTYGGDCSEVYPRTFKPTGQQPSLFEICYKEDGFLIDESPNGPFYETGLLLRSDLKKQVVAARTDCV